MISRSRWRLPLAVLAAAAIPTVTFAAPPDTITVSDTADNAVSGPVVGPAAIPEPTSIGVLAAGSVILLYRKRRRA
jgi:hypothetical protein